MQSHTQKAYDALLEHFPANPHIDVEQNVLTERASFIVQQGVLVEILEIEYQGIERPMFIVDVAIEEDALGLTFTSDGSRRTHQAQRIATSFENAVRGVTNVILAQD